MTEPLHPVHDVFVSYATPDAALADAVVAGLEHHGIRCWIAPRDITPGTLYADEIIRAINEARVLVVLLSGKAVESRHVGKEIERASSKGRAIVVLKTDAAPLTTALEYFLSESQWIHLAMSGTEAAIATLYTAVRHQLAPAALGEPDRRSGTAPPPAAAAADGRLRLNRLPLARIAAALTVIIIGASVAMMLFDAARSRSVVVEPFEVPPLLAARGQTGMVVANGVLDQLRVLQSATRISAALAASAGVDASKRDLSNAWSNKIELNTSNSPFSLAEIYHLIRNRLGHDIRISGSLVETAAGGLVLTVRGDGVLPRSITGSGEGLTALSLQAAEYIYAQSQPALWAKYLISHRRYAEVIALAKDQAVNGAEANRAYFLTFWADALTSSGGPKQEAMRLLREALSLKPDYWTPYRELSWLAVVQGDEEGGWRVGEQLRKIAGGRPGRAPEAAFSEWDILTWNLSQELTAMRGEADFFGGIAAIQSDIAQIEALRHDADAAEVALNSVDAQDDDPDAVAGTHWVRGVLGLDAGDAATASAEMEAFGAALKEPGVADDFAAERCWIALAEEAAGRTDRADAALKAAGTHVDCYRFRADILDHRGNWAAARQAYADAVALAPDLPAAFYSWGVALARHHELAAAELKLNQAHQRGPHWADPLKALGDLLAEQGRMQEAVVKYDEAIKYAPNWKQLKDAREAVSKPKN